MLINCVAYQEGKKLADIPVENISDYLAKAGCFVWVALRDPREGELAEMQKEFGLHELAVEDAMRGHQRPKMEEYGDSLFAVMHTIEQREDGRLCTGEVAVFLGANYVLSVRRDTEQSFLDVRARAEREPQLLKKGAGFVLYALMDAVVDRYFPVIEALEEELDEIEERIFRGRAEREAVEQLYDLKRKSLRLRHAVTPLLEAAGRLHGGRVPPLALKVQDYFRDVEDHLLRINGRLDTIRDTIATAIQVNLSLVTISEGEVNKRLASWAAIFAVFTAFAGLWGMNFQDMPELHWKYGYPIAVAVMVAVCGYLYYRFRKSGWL